MALAPRPVRHAFGPPMTACYGAVVPWSHAMVEGFALAGALVDDTDLGQAEGGAARDEILRARSCLSGSAQARQTKMRAIARRLQPSGLSVSDVPMPRRAKALIAEFATREVGSRWLERCPAMRKGFAAPPALRRILAREAARFSTTDHAAEGRERSAGRELLVRFERELDAAAHAKFLSELGAEEAGAIMALGPLVRNEGPLRPIERIFLDIAAQAGKGPRRVRALGALLLGSQGETEGDPRFSTWRRAGAEIAEMMADQEASGGRV